MKRRLVIEMDAGDRADSVMQEIFTVLMKYADYNEDLCFIRKCFGRKVPGNCRYQFL